MHPVRRLAPLVLLAVPLAGCGTPSAAPGPKSTTTTLFRPTSTEEPSTSAPPTSKTAPYAVEPCGGITTSSDVHPNIDNRDLLLSRADGPPGYSYGQPKTAGGPTVTAPVPSSAPAAYESFHVAAGEGGGTGQEVIGFVGSPETATQLAHQVQADLVSCDGGDQVPLPTSTPGVSAEMYHFALSRSDGWVSNATVTVPDGSYIVSLQWSNSNTCSTYGGAPCPPPPTVPPAVPSASQMAQVVNSALAKIGRPRT